MISETWYLEYDPDDKSTANKVKRAKHRDLTPDNLDPENCTAYFISSNHTQRYLTTMSSCDCNSFRNERVPCKHMFRLAMELGLIHEAFDSNSVHAVLDGKDARQTALEIVVALLEPNYDYLQFARALIASNGQPCKDVTPYSVFIDNGLVRLEHDSQFFLMPLTVTEIRTRLDAIGYRPAENQKITRAYINAHSDEICTLLFPNAYRVIPDGYLKEAPNKIREYLMYRLKEKAIMSEQNPVAQLCLQNEARYGEFKPDYTY